MSDYLWDKEGEADPEVAELEQLLRPLEYRGLPPRLPRRRPRGLWIAASVVAAAALIALLVGRAGPRPGWVLNGKDRLAVGVWLDTGERRAKLDVPEIGTVELAPGTRARILETSAGRQRMQLDHGTLSARVKAPPRVFSVEAPHVIAIDLGCAFTLTVDESGRGRLVVTEGSVALVKDGAPELTVTAGNECELAERSVPHLSIAVQAVAAPPPSPRPLEKSSPKLVVKKPKSAVQPQIAPKAAPKAAPAVAPAQHAPKPAPADDRLQHDSLKDLDRNAP